MSFLSDLVRRALDLAVSPLAGRQARAVTLGILSVIALLSSTAFDTGFRQYLQSQGCAELGGPVLLYFNSLVTTPAIARDLPRGEHYVVVRTKGWCMLKAVY